MCVWFPAFTAFPVLADFASYLLLFLRKLFFSSAILLIFGCAGSLLLRGLPLAVGGRGCPLAEGRGLRTGVASLAEHRL